MTYWDILLEDPLDPEKHLWEAQVMEVPISYEQVLWDAEMQAARRLRAKLRESLDKDKF